MTRSGYNAGHPPSSHLYYNVSGHKFIFVQSTYQLSNLTPSHLCKQPQNVVLRVAAYCNRSSTGRLISSSSVIDSKKGLTPNGICDLFLVCLLSSVDRIHCATAMPTSMHVLYIMIQARLCSIGPPFCISNRYCYTKCYKCDSSLTFQTTAVLIQCQSRITVHVNIIEFGTVVVRCLKWA